MPVHVTKSTLPQPHLLESYIRNSIKDGMFSNSGPHIRKLEQELKDYFSLQNIVLCANGTLSLQLAIRALGLSGKTVITTPFTYVATLSALLWEGCTPLFVDIDPNTLCIEPYQVEKCITSQVAGILPVHVFGNACDVEGFAHLSQKYNIPILYDAAHAFACKYQGNSLFSYGNCSVASFHATKLFHTCEGGAVFCHESSLQKKLTLLRQFGHIGDTHYSLGINAKLSELHAAVGLSVLPQVDQEITLRKEIALFYDTLLEGLPLQKHSLRQGLDYNFCYYPVIFENESSLLSVKNTLEKNAIFPRRYFYPSLNTLPYLKDEHRALLPISEKVATTILCLPLYSTLATTEVVKIANSIKTTLVKP